jgi:hypothetical protein
VIRGDEGSVTGASSSIQLVTEKQAGDYTLRRSCPSVQRIDDSTRQRKEQHPSGRSRKTTYQVPGGRDPLRCLGKQDQAPTALSWTIQSPTVLCVVLLSRQCAERMGMSAAGDLVCSLPTPPTWMLTADPYGIRLAVHADPPSPHFQSPEQHGGRTSSLLAYHRWTDGL